MQTQKRLLIISMGPFPTPEHPQVEGGGLRCWGLACGLRRNSPGLAITLSFLDIFKKPNHTAEYQGFPIITWNCGQLAEQVADYDAVLVSYCMGDASVKVAESLRPDQQLILDCYVPIYVEVCARDSADLDREYAAFMTDMKYWNHTLLRGDLFLFASAQQKRYYQGVLSAMGRINPITYGKQLMLEVPYGIHRQEPVARSRPIELLLRGKHARKVLWFGGIYPWFDLRNLIDAVAIANREHPTTLVIVGAKNPFTQHPDFLDKVRQIEEYAARPEHQGLVLMQDWIHFDERADWYLDADLVVVVNKPGDENEVAWRTRLVDFTWANIPIVTSGGDPLGEDLIAAGAAAKFPSLDAQAMARTMVSLLEQPAELNRLRERLQSFKQRLYWDVVTAQLARAIDDGQLAPDLRPRVRELLVRPAVTTNVTPPGRFRRILRLTRRIPAHLREDGIRVTALRIRAKAASHVRRLLPKPRPQPPRIVVVSHRLDLSGAPIVLLDVISRILRARLGVPIELYSYLPVHDSHLDRLRAMGVSLNLLLDRDHAPALSCGDVVLLNTAAFSPSVRETFLHALDHKGLKKVIWYVHEDEPALHFSTAEARRIKKLMTRRKLSMVTPAWATTERYRRYFGAEVVREPYWIDLPRSHHAERSPRDFETLRFVLPGSFEDARKGQLSILYAFATFLASHHRDQPELYRDFSISFVGLEEGYLSRQVRRHQKILGDRLICHPKVSRDRCLEIIRAGNVTICYSLTEALPLFVYEGMIAGHVLLRNECSGMEEQLEEGGNGFLIESADFWQVVRTIERVLNRRRTTDAQLALMSARSREIALGTREHCYEQILELIGSCFRGNRTALKGPHFDRHKPHVRAVAPSGGAEAQS